MTISPLYSRQRTWLRWGPALFFAITIFYFSSMPGDEVEKTYNSLDTIALPAATASATVAVITQTVPKETETTKPHPVIVTTTSKATAAATALPISSVIGGIPIFSSLDLLKVGHAIGYFWLGWTVLYALGLQSCRSPAMAVSLCALYAVSDEFHQRFIPGRSASARDILIDTLATLIGVAVLFMVIKTRTVFRQRHHQQVKLP